MTSWIWTDREVDKRISAYVSGLEKSGDRFAPARNARSRVSMTVLARAIGVPYAVIRRPQHEARIATEVGRLGVDDYRLGVAKCGRRLMAEHEFARVFGIGRANVELLKEVVPQISTQHQIHGVPVLSLPETLFARAGTADPVTIKLALLAESTIVNRVPATAEEFKARRGLLSKLKLLLDFDTPAPWIVAACELIGASGAVPTFASVRSLVWGTCYRNDRAVTNDATRCAPGPGPWCDAQLTDPINTWRRSQPRFLPPIFCDHREATVADLRLSVSALGNVPFTCLDLSPGEYQAPGSRLIAWICSLEDERIRCAVALVVVIQAARKASMDACEAHVRALVRRLGEIACDCPDWDFRTPEPDAMLERYCSGAICAEATPANRLRLPFIWIEAARTYERHSESLSRAEHDRLLPFAIKHLKNVIYWRNQRLYQEKTSGERARRKAKVDGLQTDFAHLRFIAEIRTNSARRLVEAVERAISEIVARRLPLPHDFTYRDTVHRPDKRNPIEQDVSIRVHSARSFHLLAKGAPVHEHNVRAMEKTDAETPLCTVELLSIKPLPGRAATEDFWFMPLMRTHALRQRVETVPADVAKKRLRLLSDERVTSRAGIRLPPGMAATRHGPYSGDSFASICRLINRGVDILYPAGILKACLFGRALLRVQTITGARIGEILQIAASPGKLKCERVPVGKKGTTKDLHSFLAIPKGHSKPSEYFIDLQTMESLLEVANCVRAEHGLSEGSLLPLSRAYVSRRKIPDDRFVFQVAGGALDSSECNGLYRFLLWGVQSNIETHTLRHAVANRLDALGVREEVIAEMLKQKDLSATRYYKQPTRSQVIAAAESLFQPPVDWSDTATVAQRLGAEQSARVLREIEAAGKLSGAFTKVIGGTCVVSHACAAKFSCINCPGKVPDPRLRSQVEAKRDDAERMLADAVRMELPAEERKAKLAINDCEAELREMTLIDIAASSRALSPSATSIPSPIRKP